MVKSLAVFLLAALFFATSCSGSGGEKTEQSTESGKKEKGVGEQFKDYMTRPLKLKKEAKELAEKAKERNELLKQAEEAAGL